MALFHVATSTPTKPELIAAWLPTQQWGPAGDAVIESIGSFHIDDPEGRVGMETHLVEADGTIFQVPLTYRDAPLAGAEAALVGEMEHSALGTRWVYDGLGDERYVTMLAGVSMTGQGQALGMAEFDGRWYVAPSDINVAGGGWTQGPVAVDGFTVQAPDVAAPTDVVLRNERFEMIVHRRPQVESLPEIGLIATWGGGPPDGIVLSEVRDLEVVSA